MLKSIPELIQEIRQQLRCVTAAEARQEIATNNGLMIDVREPNEVADRAAEGAINIPRGVLEMRMSQMHPDPHTAIYIHCATGARATLSAEQLQRIGYTNIAVITCDLETVCAV